MLGNDFTDQNQEGKQKGEDAGMNNVNQDSMHMNQNEGFGGDDGQMM